MAHVFIVDETTLPIHLQYKFAGTGAKNYNCNYLFDSSIEINANIERVLTEMIADISRVKREDKILFYLQKSEKHEGMFFGSFKAVDNFFLCEDKYLEDRLQKNLTFRVLIEADEVYEQGITERECLDSLEGITHPSQMCWSLIYRKLNGNRGCTMITSYEYEQIMKKIRQKNNNKKLLGINFDYYKDESKLTICDQQVQYNGEKQFVNILNRLISKKSKRGAYETHLQAYILQNIFNINLLKVNNEKITWIGNEMACGVGMQSIDICLIQENDERADIIICELKDEQPKEYIKNQLLKYIDWIKDYIIPQYNKKVIIHPTIIAPVPNKKSRNMYQEIKRYTVKIENNYKIEEIRYISFKEENKKIIFEEEQ